MELGKKVCIQDLEKALELQKQKLQKGYCNEEEDEYII